MKIKNKFHKIIKNENLTKIHTKFSENNKEWKPYQNPMKMKKQFQKIIKNENLTKIHTKFSENNKK